MELSLICKKKPYPVYECHMCLGKNETICRNATFALNHALPDRFLSATDHLSRNHYPIRVIFDAFGAASPGYFC
ncbi:hypothetical protein TNCV_3670061 [Trichonephila clavipes]|nr:hypothetical protein TNCV_3670061 [Trichonephila clavipes]